MLKNIINTLAGNPIERELKRLGEMVEQINTFEPEMQARDDSDLRTLTVQLREQVLAATVDIEDLDDYHAAEQAALMAILPQAFAAVREASRRATGLRHFDVQMIGGIALHEGEVAEMKTGEGKTLVASLPLYLNALAGRGAHLVTVNDYLARRDGGWMGPIFHLLGMTVGVIGKENFSAVYDPDYIDPGGDLQDQRMVHWRPTLRQECYAADVTYGTAPEFGFDYLRDNTALEISRTVQRRHPDAHVYAIVDEADSVLIDSARTPLIISGPAGEPSTLYTRFAKIIEDAHLRRNTTDVEHDEEPDGDYIMDDRTQTVALTDQGIEKIEAMLTEIDTAAGQSLYDPQYYELVHYLENALKAKYVFKRDRDYMVQQGAVILIDQTTGRPMPSRRYSEGLHQAIEAREGVQIKREDITIATITVQAYFRLYQKLGGMTGTALTQAEEFDKVYELEVLAVPTNVEFRAANGDFVVKKEKIEGVPAITYYTPDQKEEPAYYQRVDLPDVVYTTIKGKFAAAAEEIQFLREEGRPVLVGTGSVEASEYLSQELKKMSIPHEVLNAKNNDREALIVAQAGRPGAITISTSMAGRGTDIQLGGDPEGLAASAINEACFSLSAFSQVVSAVLSGDVEGARRLAAADPLMGAGVIEWITESYTDLKQKASVEDVLAQVVRDIREDKAYAGIPFDTLTSIASQINLAALDARRMDRASQIADEQGAPLSLIPDMVFRMNEYRSVQVQISQGGLADTLARRLFDQHYNARAAIVRAVLVGHLEEAKRIITQLPALSESLIDRVQAVVAECAAAKRAVWEQGGLHILGTERHESRRIDNQLRGRAARQGDPGSSRFYLSLEDDLMIRFGGDKSKAIFDRFNVPDDLPISANILSNMIEQSQARFEAYYFEVRKNLVEYDEAVNTQREIVYEERRDILEGEGEKLDEITRSFILETAGRAVERLREGYEDWALAEISSVIEDFSNFETGEVNTRGVLQRTQGLFPRLEGEDLQALLEISNADDLSDRLRDLILDGIDAGHNNLMLYAELMRIIPLWPAFPAISQNGIEGWDHFIAEARQTLEGYLAPFEEADQQSARQVFEEQLSGAPSAYRAALGGGTRPQDAQGAFYGQIHNGLAHAIEPALDVLETDELLALLEARVDELLAIARLTPGSGGGAWSIGESELGGYQRALMLSVFDQEWRQYLTAIDDLRQGIQLEAFGQRDPKVEFKRRAADMFDSLRADVREGIARRFFNDLPQHREILARQKQQEALLDSLAQSGYRVQQRVTRGQDGDVVRVAQTVHKDMWSKVGRNDPCPCGSGKKFKDCHYKQIQQQQAAGTQSEISRAGSGRSKKRGRRH
jgi:preprotein translocase subunit SecA